MTPAEKGTKLMADMGTGIVSKMSSPSMPSDSSIKGTLEEVAKAVDDYTEKAASAVKDMAEKLLGAVKEAIQKAIGKSKPEIPKPTDIQAAIKEAIEKAAPK